jgi:hypothetical protein
MSLAVFLGLNQTDLLRLRLYAAVENGFEPLG